jgi:hypothetical protein
MASLDGMRRLAGASRSDVRKMHARIALKTLIIDLARRNPASIVFNRLGRMPSLFPQLAQSHASYNLSVRKVQFIPHNSRNWQKVLSFSPTWTYLQCNSDAADSAMNGAGAY